jgi:hypothetical protein
VHAAMAKGQGTSSGSRPSAAKSRSASPCSIPLSERGQPTQNIDVYMFLDGFLALHSFLQPVRLYCKALKSTHIL